MENQSTKGFTLLELMVVVAILGVISAVGIPNILSWSTDRNVRSANENTASLITTLNTQTQRGVYPFTQILVTPNQNNTVVIEAKGKTRESISRLDEDLACDMADDYWNTVVSSSTFEDVFVHVEDRSAICFSKDEANYEVVGGLFANPAIVGNDLGAETNNYLIFCASQDNCDDTPEEPAYMVVWSRFGNVSKFKYSSDEWIMQ